LSTAIANRDGEVILSAAEVELVKRTVAKDATDEELRLFLHDCRRQGVHPLDKLIHFTKRGGRYTPITSIDHMRSRAADTGELAGNDDPVFTFKDGETVIPISASVTVWRMTQGQRFPYTSTARWTEYKPPSGQDMMWMKMPQLMLGKCAEALALRKAFPKQLHGVYERAEMEQAGKEDRRQGGVSDGEARMRGIRSPVAPAQATAAPIIPSDDRKPTPWPRCDHCNMKTRTTQKWTGPKGDDNLCPECYADAMSKPTRDAQKERAVASPSAIGAVQHPRSDEPAREPQSEAELIEESETLFPDPERDALIAEIKKLAKNIPAGDKAEAATTYLGMGVSLEQADMSALADLKGWCLTRVKR
jgi:phage recombination protein Bet